MPNSIEVCAFRTGALILEPMRPQPLPLAVHHISHCPQAARRRKRYAIMQREQCSGESALQAVVLGTARKQSAAAQAAFVSRSAKADRQRGVLRLRPLPHGRGSEWDSGVSRNGEGAVETRVESTKPYLRNQVLSGNNTMMGCIRSGKP